MEILDVENLGYSYRQINVLMQISKEDFILDQRLFYILKPESSYTKYNFCKNIALNDKIDKETKSLIFYNIEDKFDFEKIDLSKIDRHNVEAMLRCLELDFFPKELYTSSKGTHHLANEIEGLYHNIKIDDYNLCNSNNICYLIQLKDADFDLNLLKKDNIKSYIDEKIKIMCEEEIYDVRILDERCNDKNIDLILYCFKEGKDPELIYRHNEDGQNLLLKTLSEFGELYDLIDNDWSDQTLAHVITIGVQSINVDIDKIVKFEKNHSEKDNDTILDILWSMSGYTEGAVKEEDIDYILENYENFLYDKDVFSDLICIDLDNKTFKELIRLDPMERRDMIDIYKKIEYNELDL